MRSKFFTIKDAPIPLQRPRYSQNHVWDSQKHQKMVIGVQFEQQMLKNEPFSGPLEIDINFYFAMPKRLSSTKRDALRLSYHHCRPDIDNLIKMYLDCANGILFKDDAIIAVVHSRKLYDDTERTELTISELL